MNCKTFRFTVISIIFMFTKEFKMSSSKKIPLPDMNPISDQFADLLNSLVQVNVERVNVLKKLFKLYDVNEAKQLLRNAQDKKDYVRSEALPYDNQNEYQEIINKLADSDSEEAFFDELAERAASQEDIYDYGNLRFQNDKHVKPVEVDSLTFLSMDNKQLSNGTDDSISSDSQSSLENAFFTPLKSENSPSLKSRDCISPRRGYEDCKTSCRRAYGHACAYNDCSKHLYKRLRKECRHACSKTFIQPYDDYD